MQGEWFKGPGTGHKVKARRIWIIPPQNDYNCIRERATLSKHPQRDLSKPALPFPCAFLNLKNSWNGWQELFTAYVMKMILIASFKNKAKMMKR